MLLRDVKVGGTYRAKINGRVVPVIVEEEVPVPMRARPGTQRRFWIRSLATGYRRTVTAAKLR